MAREPRGSTGETPGPGLSKDGYRASLSAEHVYRGRRDPSATVGEECTVTVDDERLDCRYDLLSASPAGFEWSYRGSGPAQLAIALLAHAFDDGFASEYYQQFKREVVATLPENGWTLTEEDLNHWREVNVDGSC